MMRNQMTITVSGGTVEENQQLTTLVQASLLSQGFSNVSASPLDVIEPKGVSIFDLCRSQNPDIFDTPIFLIGETDEDVRASESAAFQSMMGSYSPNLDAS